MQLLTDLRDHLKGVVAALDAQKAAFEAKIAEIEAELAKPEVSVADQLKALVAKL